MYIDNNRNPYCYSSQSIFVGGKSAALPDLNTKWIINTREFLIAIRSHNYPAMFGCLLTSNAMLPDKYQVKISNNEYNKLIKQDLSVICNHCNTETKHQDIDIQTILTNHSLSTITGQRTERVWHCNKCNKTNLLTKTRMIQDKMAEPYYLQVVPSPPTRKGTLTDRSEYHRIVEKWAWQFYSELEHQMSLYRIEYRPKSDEVEENEFMDEAPEMEI